MAGKDFPERGATIISEWSERSAWDQQAKPLEALLLELGFLPGELRGGFTAGPHEGFDVDLEFGHKGKGSAWERLSGKNC